MRDAMKLASERNLNKNLYPVIPLKGRKIEYPLTLKNMKGIPSFICENGILRPKEMMMLDILATTIIHHNYSRSDKNGKENFSNRIPTANEPNIKHISSLFMSFKLLSHVTKDLMASSSSIIGDIYTTDFYSTISHIDPAYKRLKKVPEIKINDMHLKSQLPFLSSYTSQSIKTVIKNLSEFSVKMIMAIRFYDGKKYVNFPFNNSYTFSKFFTLTEVTNAKISKDKKVLEREYTIRFNTVLGYFFVQNCLSLYTDLLPGKFYEMTDYAQLFHRHLILPYYNDIKNPIGMDEIKNRLVLHTPDTYMNRKTVKRILDELESNKLINEPKETKLNGQYFYSYKKTDWKDVKDLESTSKSHLVRV